MLYAWKKSVLMLLAGAWISIGFTGCGSGSDEFPRLSGQEARDVFENSESVLLTGDINDVNTFTDVIADGMNVGELREHGFFNSRITYSVDGEEQFYIAYCDHDEEDKVVEDENHATSTTYTYYDMDGDRLGYAQDRALFKGDDEWYVMVFLDTEGNMKNYYIEPYDDWWHDWARGGAGVYNMDREKVGEISLELTNIFTDSYSIGIELGAAADELSEMDRAAIYKRCVREMNHVYAD
ncbi:MAG TPA: hypothetical protein DCL38_03760 [Lachnospiraceae bacterium]|nr:hypothetical protein [Lachnospiraceae bacterium]